MTPLRDFKRISVKFTILEPARRRYHADVGPSITVAVGSHATRPCNASGKRLLVRDNLTALARRYSGGTASRGPITKVVTNVATKLLDLGPIHSGRGFEQYLAAGTS
jgi:hypothetical protein